MYAANGYLELAKLFVKRSFRIRKGSLYRGFRIVEGDLCKQRSLFSKL